MTKEVTFDKLTRDWAMRLDGEYIGSRPTPKEAREELDRVALEQIKSSDHRHR
jgi:hypothetical protein